MVRVFAAPRPCGSVPTVRCATPARALGHADDCRGEPSALTLAGDPGSRPSLQRPGDAGFTDEQIASDAAVFVNLVPGLQVNGSTRPAFPVPARPGSAPAASERWLGLDARQRRRDGGKRQTLHGHRRVRAGSPPAVLPAAEVPMDRSCKTCGWLSLTGHAVPPFRCCQGSLQRAGANGLWQRGRGGAAHRGGERREPGGVRRATSMPGCPHVVFFGGGGREAGLLRRLS